jgi:hypothetical protein
MGRQARLKKIRHEVEANPEASPNVDPAQFVKQLKQQGYNLQQIERSPELPNDNPEPQL